MKNILYPIIFCGILCIGATRCSSDTGGSAIGGKGNSKIILKPEWTKDMRVSCSYSGGMVNESRHIEISSDSAVYEVHEDQITQRHKLNLSKEELDALAKVFYENDFVNIQSSEREGTLYDAPSASVLLCVGPECVNKGDDAYSVYKGEDAKRIERVSSYLWALGNKKLDALKIPFTVVIDETLLKGKDDVHYQIAPGGISITTNYNGRHDREEIKVLPGSLAIMANTVTKDSLGNTRYPLSANQTFATNEGNTILISLKKGALNIELKKM